jgi:ABC-type transport system, involved in lipoprotein release, permease component
VIGIIGAFALTRVMQTMLFNVNPTDPVTFLEVSLVLMVVASLAGYFPALRATRVDPLIALRYE